MKKAYLYLENGQVLEGHSFGAAGTAMGELVFTTGMTGCVESLTDPSYYGQAGGLHLPTVWQLRHLSQGQREPSLPDGRRGGPGILPNPL